MFWPQVKWYIKVISLFLQGCKLQEKLDEVLLCAATFKQSSQVAERVTSSLQLASLFSMCKFVASWQEKSHRITVHLRAELNILIWKSMMDRRKGQKLKENLIINVYLSFWFFFLLFIMTFHISEYWAGLQYSFYNCAFRLENRQLLLYARLSPSWMLRININAEQNTRRSVKRRLNIIVLNLYIKFIFFACSASCILLAIDIYPKIRIPAIVTMLGD